MSIEPLTKPHRVASGERLATVWWKTGRMTVKAGGAETGDAFAQIEIGGRRGDATPRHLHQNEDETSYVLEGELTLFVGDERIDLRAGDSCFAPRGLADAHMIRSERARFLTTISPAGVEQMFVALGVLVTGDDPPADLVMPPREEMARMFAGYGCDILGPPLTLDEL